MEDNTSESFQKQMESPIQSQTEASVFETTAYETIQVSDETNINSQPSPNNLFEKGFITPTRLHFTRNHGSIPGLDWNKHELHIKGLVKHPKVFSMDDLMAMPSLTFPVSITSGGNRANEQNAVKPTQGLLWGAAATSCSFWTGVRLCHLLRLCQVDVTKARHVNFEATSLEELPNGSYVSSIDIATAIDTLSDVIIAYKQNGDHLRKEAGFPIRLIVPGWIGARMVKWLSAIEVTETPSQNFYYRSENRVFSSIVQPELEGVHRYLNQNDIIFNELNINSVIIHPFHKQTLRPSLTKKYEIKGYAYSGNGRKICKVELSFDAGETWKECHLKFPEEKQSHAPHYGKYYCWMFWNYNVDVSALIKAAKETGEIRCRAWDQSCNVQPREMNWNMLGCGNNSHFIIRAMYIPGVESHGQDSSMESTSYIKFFHPAMQNIEEKGWLKSSSQRETSHSGVFLEEGIDGKDKIVYPSFSQLMQNEENEDNGVLQRRSTKAMVTISNANEEDSKTKMDIESLSGFSVCGGKIDEPGSEESKTVQTMHSLSRTPATLNGKMKSTHIAPGRKMTTSEPIMALDPDSWLSFELIEKQMISFDTRIFKFKLPSEKHYLGVPVGQHVLVRIIVNGDPLIRAYTPISKEKQLGYFTLCIKIYFAGADIKHPNGGKMSQFMECMLLGDKLCITGPHGKVHYKGNGIFNFKGKEKKYRNVGMICGGSGITPAFQVMHEVYQNKEDDTDIFLLYANRTHYDVLLQADLDLMEEKRENIHVWYTLERAPDCWIYSQGLVTEQMIRERIPAPTDESVILLCGPPEMITSCTSSLRSIGYKEENVFAF
ncbi:unnamed protein product [Agarophyton chilense]